MEQIWSIWWLWLIISLGLAIVELLVPGFLFLGFAFGALAVALLLLNSSLLLTLPALLLIFASLSLVAWLVMRRIFVSGKNQVKTFDYDIND